MQIPAGASYSGPFMNPAVAFSWYWNLKGASAWEHFVVFWAGCLVGSYLAGVMWNSAKPSTGQVWKSRNTSESALNSYENSWNTASMDPSKIG